MQNENQTKNVTENQKKQNEMKWNEIYCPQSDGQCN